MAYFCVLNKAQIMFFVGILSSIIPYIATIIVMCLYLLVGQSATTIDECVENSTKTFTIEQSCNDSSNQLTSIFSYDNTVYLFSKLNNTSTTYCQYQKIILLCPDVHYNSLSAHTAHNKAPPFII